MPDDIDFSIVNLFPHAIFSQVDLEIDGVNLSTHDNLYPYKSYLETMLSYGGDAKVSQLTTSLFVKDTAYNFDAGANGNNGYVKRRNEVKGSRIFDFCINPHIDFLHTPRLLPSDIPMKVKLARSNDSFSILSSTDDDLCVKIHNLSRFIYRVQPSDRIRKLYNNLLIRNMLYFQ